MTEIMRGLPSGFECNRVAVGKIGLQVVTGGAGSPVMLIPGWPQTWYAWRDVAPRLASAHSVVVAEPRGIGGSDKPEGPYDVGTVAAEMIALMDRLGHVHFDVVGHDLGAWIAYAMVIDFPDRVGRTVLVDAAIPGVTPPPSALAPAAVNKRVWHFGFNRLDASLNEALVRGREDIFFAWQFRNKAARPDSLSDADIGVYVDAYRDPAALRAGFDYYRAVELNIGQNARRTKIKIKSPIMIVAGEKGVGQAMVEGLAQIGSDVHSRVLGDVGHYVPDEAPAALAEAILAFLSRSGSV